MKIEATCRTCGRTFLLTQIGPESDAPGRCPFCGARFAPHYSTILVEAVRDAEMATTTFVQMVGRLQAMETGFDIDIDRLLDRVAEQVRSHEQQQQAHERRQRAG
jgi:DNA-directed RNA polymerase subunit RPC12/RpoP